MKTVPAATHIIRFRGTVSRAQYWVAGGVVGVMLVCSLVLARGLGSALDSTWAPVAFGNVVSVALVYAVTALTVARLRHLGASLWWMAAWPLTAPLFWVIVGLLTPEAATAIRTLLTFRDNVTRTRFWTVGGWLFLTWVVWFWTAALIGFAGGWFPTVLLYAWLAFTPVALFIWTSLLVGRLRDIGASLRWMVLWPLTLPVFWLVVGVLPKAGDADEGTGAVPS